MRRYLLYITLFCTGALILMLEIAGSRIIIPFYGSSIFVWSSLITVTMAALAAGYYMGGTIIDKSPHARWFPLVLLLAGIAIALIPFLRTPLLLFSQPLGVRWGPLVASFLLFTVPLMTLSMMTPMAVRLRLKNVGDAGSLTGRLYALSTLGSLAGAILTGFILLPQYSVIVILKFAAGFIIALALIWVLSLAQLWDRSVKILVIIGFVLIVLPVPTPSLADGVELVYQTPSFFGDIKVVDFDDKRYLLINGTAQNVMYKDTHLSASLFSDVMRVARLLHPQPETALAIGLGAGHVPSAWRSHGLTVDIVELDEKVADVARDYFYFNPENFGMHYMDGRRYLAETDKRYDLIAFDAYGGETAPPQLMSKEALTLVKKRLTDDGIMVANIVYDLDTKLTQSYYYMLSQLFEDVMIIEGGNLIFFASDTLPEDIMQTVLASCETSYCRDFYSEVISGNILDVSELPLAQEITDDQNPVYLWQAKNIPRYRKWWWQFFGPELLTL